MATEQPLVSVVVCIYNAGDYLRASVQSILNQTYRNLEILLVDDGSTDGCVGAIGDLIAGDPRIRVIRQSNSGKPAAMNRALDELRGAFYALNDADDLSHPQRIERQVQAMAARPEVAGVFCGNELLLGNRRVAPVLRERDEEYCRKCVEIFRMPAHDPTAMYRMELVGDFRYETSLPIVEGYDYILRVGEKLPLRVVGECLYSYRIHNESVTRRDPDRRSKLVFEVLRRACVRRGLDPEKVLGAYEDRAASTNRDLDNNLAAHFIQSALDLRDAGERWAAIGVGVACARLHLLDPHYYKAMIYALARADHPLHPREAKQVMEEQFFAADYHGQTTLHPVGAAAMAVFGLLILVLPRRMAIWPIILMACFISPAQRIVLFTLDFNMLRVMVLFGWLRLLARNEVTSLTWNRLDILLILWTLMRSLAVVLQGMGLQIVVLQLGRTFDAIGMYFLFRQLIRGWGDAFSVVKAISVISLPVAAAFLYEHATARNLFAVFGGLPEITVTREDRLRCQGAFAHPILAGCFWATMLPLVASRVARPSARILAAAATAAIFVIVFACASSTPVMAIVFGIVGCLAFFIRRQLWVVRWGVVVVLLGLAVVMNKPVWHLIARIHVVSGSTSWHRYKLIDAAIEHWDEWFIMGSTRGSAHWGWGLYDITNDYIVQAMQGGILQLVLFIAIIVTAFGATGRLWRHVETDREKLWFAWALGVCLFAHAMNFIAVSYFGQSIMMWFLTLGVIGSLAPKTAPVKVTARAAARPRRRLVIVRKPQAASL